MRVDIDDLPEKYRKLVQRKLCDTGGVRERPPGNKYNAVGDQRGSLHFASKKEARRYDALVVLLRSGEIEDLRVQPEFTLTEAYTTPEGKRIRAMRYRADYSYRRDGKLIVEDVKSKATKTQLYRNKCKLMREIYGIDVQEVETW